ncbi:MAG: Tsi3 family protein [Pseudomonadota bacterium]
MVVARRSDGEASDRTHGGFLPAAMAALVLLTGCDDAPEVALGAAVTHDNGLAVRPPQGWDVATGPDGFTLQGPGDLRAPRRLALRLAEAAPLAGGPVERDGRGAEYTIAALGAGSGGTLYRLTAWRPLGGRMLVMTAEQQSEDGEPAFPVAWASFASATVD